ncbi:hypothetical protein AMTR_s00002p00048370 [Amborella trichopoda]|uniref:LOB domain-containing protein n=2 Tax=Amborella trichopoda TaxID=13333 RepID=W1NZ61_AMBTC|nr:hypothetical protein AMTR_s00002p00048370 [Amborella trichopoda]
MLQSHLRQIHAEIGTIQLELSKYLGPHLQIGPSSSSLGFTIALGNKSTGTPPPQLNFLDVQSMGTPPPQLNFLDVQNQQQQLLAEQQHQEMISSYDGDVARMNAAAAAAVTGTSTSPVTGFDGGYGGQGALGFMGPYVQQSRVSFENGFEPKIIGTQFETGFEEKMAGSGRDAVQ